MTETPREVLPQRRRAETFRLTMDAHSQFDVTVGFYPDGRIGEVFINGGKSGSAVEAIARDSAVLLSLALQHGVPIDVMKGAITRERNNWPMTIIGAVIDKLVEMKNVKT